MKITAYPPQETPQSALLGHTQVIEFGVSGSGGFKKHTTVSVLSMAWFVRESRLSEEEYALLAARRACVEAQEEPPPLAPTLQVTKGDISRLVMLAVTEDVARASVERFCWHASDVMGADYLDAAGVALPTRLPLQVVRRALFQLERGGVLEVYSEAWYRVRPELVRQRVAAAQPTPSALPAPRPAFSRLTSDPPLVAILEDRWDEAQRLLDAPAPRFALVAYGSLLEGVLYAKASSDPRTANTQAATPKDSAGRARLLRDWSLSDLIQVAEQAGWIHVSRGKFGQVLREYRNYVHPREEHASGVKIDAGTVEVARAVVVTTINDLLS